MNRKAIAGAVMSSVLLTACPQHMSAPPGGGNAGGGGNTTGYTKFGYVTVGSTRLPGQLSGQTFVVANGFFYSAPATGAIPSAPTGAADTCFVVKGPLNLASVGNSINTPSPGAPFTSVDAGQSVVIKSGAATYATLTRSAPAANFFSYVGPASSAPTTNLTVSIPGAANGFPAFSDAAFPNTLPAPLTLTAPTNNAPVTADTIFTWDGASNDANSFVLLVNLQVLSAQAAIYAVCNARDDGSFTFPDATKATLAAQGWTTGNLFIASRSITKTVTQGDAALVLAINDAEVYPLTSLPGLPGTGATSR